MANTGSSSRAKRSSRIPSIPAAPRRCHSSPAAQPDPATCLCPDRRLLGFTPQLCMGQKCLLGNTKIDISPVTG